MGADSGEHQRKALCIINSHAHPDHFWGNTYFREVAPNVPIVTCAGGSRIKAVF
ncbi:MBL fold metallo-hydrolase [Pseudomonas veronii]|uniref:MBL fold metallo-hydrolase n=1 Tax=Pseudomonas veronii TaxID=76761 RepID=UPI0036F1D746